MKNALNLAHHPRRQGGAAKIVNSDTRKFLAINGNASLQTAARACENLMSTTRKSAEKSGNAFHQGDEAGRRISAKSPQIGFHEIGSALRESGSERCCFGRVASMTADPCEQRHPSEQDEGVQFHCLRFRKRSNSPVPSHPSLLQGRNLRVVFNERDARREIVKMPAEAAIVEIDQRGLISAGEQVCQSHIRMDQPVARRRLAECSKTPLNRVLRSC